MGVDDDEVLESDDERAISEREALGGPLRPRSQAEFDTSYEGQPPWDIGRPQAAFVELVETGSLVGRVLDVGCGTGEHALLAAAAGHDACGIDLAATAIARARHKARDRGLSATFFVHDALDLVSLAGPFETVLDSGLFHVLPDDARLRYAEQLHSVTSPGGRYFMLAFSDRQPGDWGPRRISQDELRDCFAHGWHIDALDASYYEVNLHPGRAEAWLATVTRT